MTLKPFNIICIILSTLLLSSCVERFRPELDKYDDLLVVDGQITNLPPPYIVRLSKSSPLYTQETEAVTDCEVIISDDIGTDEILSEVEPGVYQTDSLGIQGIIGRQYKISIRLGNGSYYESDFEELKHPVELDSVYAQIEHREAGGYDHTLDGYQFYLNTKEAPSDTNYLLWNLEAIYHYQSDYTIRWVWEGTLEWFHAPWKYYNCWIDDPISDIFVLSTSGLNSPNVNAFPLHFVDTETRKLSVKYSLLVKQFTINEEAYAFYEGIQNNSDQGSLYEQQPGQIRGNVHNTSNMSEPVLGNFLVAGVHQKRIFVDPLLWPSQYYYSKCVLNEGDFDDYADLLWLGWHEIPVYVIETPGGRRAVPNQSCVDCRRKGGTVEKPDFWEE